MNWKSFRSFLSLSLLWLLPWFYIFSFCCLLPFLFPFTLRSYFPHLRLPFVPSSCPRSFFPNCVIPFSPFSLLESFFLSFCLSVLLSSSSCANHSVWTSSPDVIRTSDSLRAGKSYYCAITASLPTHPDPHKTWARRRIEQYSPEHLPTDVAC
jgi:hypothetical protein